MKLHGIKVPHKKNTANCVPVRLSVPETVRIPMSMHIGKPAKATKAALSASLWSQTGPSFPGLLRWEEETGEWTRSPRREAPAQDPPKP